MRAWQPQIQNRRADNIKPGITAHAPKQQRIGALRHFRQRFKPRGGGEGFPMRRLQPRNAPAFLVNQNRRGFAQHIANLSRQRA